MLAVSWILPRISLPIAVTAKIPIAPIAIMVLMTAILRRSNRCDSVASPQPFDLARAGTPA